MEKSSANRIYRAIGLMSGTSMDGIDAALIETDGQDVIRRIGFHSVSHDPALRQAMMTQLNQTTYDTMIEDRFTTAQVPVIEALLDKVGLSAAEIDVIGFHGQSLHHDPERGLTVQMANGQLLADETGIDVVYDFRSADVKNGGQGAPLIPIYHAALVKAAGLDLPVAILNLGGVGNITWIAEDKIIGFDTGPANAMIDDWIAMHTDMTYDKDGEIAARGTVHQDIVDRFLSLPYFTQPYPKSLDRNDFEKFASSFGLTKGSEDPSIKSRDDTFISDGAATLTAMTVQAIAKAIDLCPTRPCALFVTGGGRHNRFMMGQIAKACQCLVESVDTLVWDGDAMEAEGFAYMAVRSLLGQPYSFPTTTGCATPTCGGVHVQPKRNAA